eukprot:TRINITY_DN15729_c0_g1_i5.p1 TRINITY_DN15729_c0_g1~~TRINITY_DN15729_c0_g1_i5.p1  ORF type:complete len:443 (-),score=47.68 TRINITY_DN15729_c0_g1_i5:568-1896(-)
MTKTKKKVAYYYDSEFKTLYFGPDHPMKPQRLEMTHHLVLSYGLHKYMDIYRIRKAHNQELTRFHAEDYINMLSKITPVNVDRMDQEKLRKFNIMTDDCPVFDGLYDFVQLYTGASLDAAARLNGGSCDIAVNWAGGLHHAKRQEASGFCYINDLVLAILELLKVYARVLYIDIDIHHGDGVEEAFYTTDRVMTISFHKYGDSFFPGTGALDDLGEYNGRYYSVNVPLKDGCNDDTFWTLFEPIIDRAIERFRPGAIVLQCGADPLARDRLGCFNLSIQGHAKCVKHLRDKNIPLLVTGGGGYTKTNVAKCWTYEVAVIVGAEDEMVDTIPEGPMPDLNWVREYFGPDYSLNIKDYQKDMSNQNKSGEVQRLLQQVLQNLDRLEHAPGVQMTYMPPQYLIGKDLVDTTEEQTERRLQIYAKDHGYLEDSADARYIIRDRRGY